MPVCIEKQRRKSLYSVLEGKGKMLIALKSYQEIDPRKLMDLYREGNEENIDYFYPDCKDRAKALKEMEASFLEYIEKEFFAEPGNVYYVLEKDDVWVSTLRLYVRDGYYYLEALETDPNYRKRGYASEILLAVFEELKKDGSFIVRDSVNKKNVASLATHKKCGFEIEQQDAVNDLTGEVNPKSYGMIYRWNTEQSA